MHEPAAEQPILRGERVTLRPPGAGDLDRILRVLSDPTVVRWWGEYDAARVEATYADPEDEVVFMIEVRAELAGFIQCGEEPDPEYRHCSIDIALLEEFQGKGFGPEAIDVLVRYLFEVRGHHRITIDPAVANENAIKAYERAGFERVGVMRQYERLGDGPWHDSDFRFSILDWVSNQSKIKNQNSKIDPAPAAI